MTDIVQALYGRIQKMTPSRLNDAYLMDIAGIEIKALREERERNLDSIRCGNEIINGLHDILNRIVKRNPDGTIAIRLTEDALNAAAEYLPPNA